MTTVYNDFVELEARSRKLSFLIRHYAIMSNIDIGLFIYESETVLVVDANVATFEEYCSALKIEDEKERMTLRLKLGKIFSF